MISTLSEDVIEELINQHLAVHCLMLPWRFGETPELAVTAINERRGLYQHSGISDDLGGDPVTRQRRSRLLRGMAREGLIALNGFGRAQCVKFTQQGYIAACSLTPGDAPWDVWHLLPTIAALADAGYQHPDGGWVLENWILDCNTPTVGQLTRLEDEATALITLGWLESMSDTCSRLGYRVTAAGRLEIENGPMREPPDAPDYCAEVADSYIDRWLALTTERKDWQPVDARDLVIPLSAGLWSNTDG